MVHESEHDRLGAHMHTLIHTCTRTIKHTYKVLCKQERCRCGQRNAFPQMFSVTFYKDVTWQLRRFENKAACRCYLGLATENAVSIQALSYHYVCWEHAITHTFICSAPFVSCTALHMFFQCNSSRPGPRQSQSIVIKAFFGFCATCSITTTTNYPHNPLIILIFFPP